MTENQDMYLISFDQFIILSTDTAGYDVILTAGKWNCREDGANIDEIAEDARNERKLKGL